MFTIRGYTQRHVCLCIYFCSIFSHMLKKGKIKLRTRSAAEATQSLQIVIEVEWV